MSSEKTLQDVVVALGYRSSDGYVDQPARNSGARGFIWSDLRQKCGVNAAFFKGAVPVVAFAAAESRSDAMRTQRRLWNYGRVPVLIAATESEILALSCNTAGTRDPDAALLAHAHGGQDLASVLADFTRFSVESGHLTERHYRQLDKRNRVDQALLRNLQELRVRLLRAGVPEDDIEPLLGRSIFVRYLEDRGILLAEDLSRLELPESLVSALDLDWAAVSSLFDAMSDHFNGDVFRRDAISLPVPKEALNELSDFFRAADLVTGQQSLWPYDFAIIPPELISSIYEQLLITKQKSDAAYYTPRHVVDLVLDELLSPEWWSGATRTILDPACGSGIFLTEAFRRMVYQRTIGREDVPTFDEFADLLVDSVFGVDKNADAIGVAAFGLYLALLEHVDPRTAWLNARLPNLIGTNLVVSDFFDDHSLAARKFDAVVGNPPWQSRLSPAAVRYLQNRKCEAPDRQIAVAFVWRAAELLSDDGLVGMVLPSKTILHNRGRPADRFRLEFFSTLDVRIIIDLSPLRRDLFGTATSPAMIAVFGQGEDRDEAVLHVSPRRTPVAQIADAIAIPQQNIRRIPRSTTMTDPALWKPLLWGGLADLALVRHLRENFKSLRSIADMNKWSDGPGFQIVNNGDENDASHLAEIPYLRTAALHAMRLPTELDDPVTAPVMHRPRGVAIYRAPHILMRKGFRTFPEATFLPYDASFTDGLSAIAADAAFDRQLRAIAAILNSSVARYWFLMTASSWGVEREQLHHREWMSLPLPPLTEDQIETLLTLVNDAAMGEPEASWRPAMDRAVEKAYGLTAVEQQVIADALTVRWSELRSGWRSPSYRPPSDRHLDDYASTLRGHLDELEVGLWNASVSERSHGFAMVTCRLRDDSGSDPLAKEQFSIEHLMSDPAHQQDGWLSSVTIIEPEAVVLEGTAVHLIKPDRLSCWMWSCARDDAASVFSALLTGESADTQEPDA